MRRTWTRLRSSTAGRFVDDVELKRGHGTQVSERLCAGLPRGDLTYFASVNVPRLACAQRPCAGIQIQIQIRPWKQVATLTSTAPQGELTRRKPLISRPPSQTPRGKAARHTCPQRNNADK